MSDPNLNIYQRLNAVMKEVDYCKKTGHSSEAKLKSFVCHDYVVSLVHNAFVEHGIYFTHEILTYKSERIKNQKGVDQTFTDITMRCWFINIDNPTDRTSIDVPGQGMDPNDLSPGKAVSYAKKYALLNGLLLPTGEKDPEDDSLGDGNGKQPNKNQSSGKPQNKPSTPPKEASKQSNDDSELTLHEQLVLLSRKLFSRANAALKQDGLPAYGNIDPLMEDLTMVLESKTPGIDQTKLDSARANSDKIIVSLVGLVRSKKAAAA